MPGQLSPYEDEIISSEKIPAAHASHNLQVLGNHHDTSWPSELIV